MKKRDRKELERYVRWVADEMELRDWTIVLWPEPCEDRNDGTMQPASGQKIGNLRVNKAFRDLDPERQRTTIVHELLHCHWHAAWAMVDEDLEKALGAQGDILFSVGFNRNAEYAIDATARAIAKHMPLIDWPA